MLLPVLCFLSPVFPRNDGDIGNSVSSAADVIDFRLMLDADKDTLNYSAKRNENYSLNDFGVCAWI